MRQKLRKVFDEGTAGKVSWINVKDVSFGQTVFSHRTVFRGAQPTPASQIWRRRSSCSAFRFSKSLEIKDLHPLELVRELLSSKAEAPSVMVWTPNKVT